MKRIIILVVVLIAAACTNKEDSRTGNTLKSGYVLKGDQGTILPDSDSSLIFKVSPEQGSENNITVVQKIKPGKGTGLHYHTDADEIFYIIEGTGTIVLGNKSHTVEAGDFIFIPRNTDHKIRKYDSTGILKVVFFMDKPGLLYFFKERHKQFYIDKKPMTLEELNKVAEKYGTHFKTLN